MRRGFVLLSVLGALLLLGAVAVSAWFAALQEWRIAANTEAALLAREAALSGIADALAAGGGPLAAVPEGAVLDMGAGSLPGVEYRTRARRHGSDVFAIEGWGRDLRLGMERTDVVPARLVPLVPRARAAAVLRSPPGAPLAARLFGGDSTPPGWSCFASPDSAPSEVVDPLTPDSAFFALGPLTWARLLDWTRRGTAVDSPLVTASGDTTLDGARVRGILVVDGTLELRGGAEVIGTVVSRSQVAFGPGGGTLIGSLVTPSVQLLPGASPGDVLVAHSSCAVRVVGRFRAPLAVLPGARPVPAW